jgi:hypothetical protein
MQSGIHSTTYTRHESIILLQPVKHAWQRITRMPSNLFSKTAKRNESFQNCYDIKRQFDLKLHFCFHFQGQIAPEVSLTRAYIGGFSCCETQFCTVNKLAPRRKIN